MLSVRTLYAHFQHHKLPFLSVPLSTYPRISVSQFLLVSSSSLQFQLLSVANLTLSLLYIPLCFFFPNFTFFQRSLPSSVSCHPDYFFNYKVLLFSVTPLCLTLAVASSGPAISRVHAALTLPITSLSCLVPHHSLCSLLPPASPSSSRSLPLSVHILFLPLHLPGYQGEEN